MEFRLPQGLTPRPAGVRLQGNLQNKAAVMGLLSAVMVCLIH